MPFEIQIQMRFNDLDGYAHVNNANYFSFMEVARTKAFGPMVSEGLEKGIAYLVVSAEIHYKKPIRFDDDVYILVWVSEAKGVKFKAEYKIHNGKGAIFATANTVHAMIDVKTGRPLRLTDEIKSSVENLGI